MIRQAVERPISTFIGAATLVVVGVFSLIRLPVSLLPSIERPRLVVQVEAEGHSREEMLHRVTEPLERRFLSLAGVRSVHSETGDGLSRISLETEWQTDADRLRIEAERRIAGLETDAYDRLTVELEVGDRSPIVEVAVFGGTAAARTSFADEVLVPEMARLPGAGRVETVGRAPLHVVVRPRAAALAARGLTAADLVERLESVGRPIAAGRARDGGQIRPLVVRETVTSTRQLRELRLPAKEGLATLGDVASVEVEEISDGSWFRRDAQEGLQLRIFRAPGANAVALAQRARRQLDELGRRMPAGLSLEVVNDRSREVVAALAQLGLAAVAGLLLGTLVLRTMLGRWRPTLALAVVIPASIVISFAAFYLWGVSLDVIALAGLALAAGMLVDNSIVVLESIEAARARGERQATVEGTRQIALALVAGFLTTAVVFLPLVYLEGLARAFFGVQAFAIVTSLLVSLLLSLTVTPALAGRRARSPSDDGAGAETRPGLRRRAPGLGLYRAALAGILAWPRTVLAFAAVLVAAALATGWNLPRELMPDGSPRELTASFQLPPGLTPEEARRRGDALDRALDGALAEIRASDSELPTRLSSRRGDDGPAAARSGDEPEGRIDLRFDSVEAAAQALEAAERALAAVPGARVEIEPRTSAFIEVFERARDRVEILASAPGETATAALADRLTEHLRSAGFAPRRDQRSLPQPALRLTWDRARLGTLGASSQQLEAQTRSGLGAQAGRVEIPDLEPEIRVEAALRGGAALVPLRPGAGSASGEAREVVPLGALARLSDELRAPRTQRLQGRPTQRLLLDLDSRGDLAHDQRRLASALEDFLAASLAPGEAVQLGGEALELARSFRQLRLALILSLVLVFLTLAALYESLTLPLVIMSTVPVAAAGALLGLAATGQSLNVMSFLGVILLTGIVVNNSIVLVHRIEQHRRTGTMSLLDAVRRGAAERYRPIVMTTLTTILGMLPLAALGGEGVELRRALGLAVISGLVTSTAASLLLVPAFYALVRRPEPRDHE